MNFTAKALREWGMTHVWAPGLTNYQTDLESEYKEATQGLDQLALLKETLTEVRQGVENAKAIFSDIKLITSTEEDEIWNQAKDAFHSLDTVVFLEEGIIGVIKPEKDSLENQILQEFDQLYGDLGEWLDDGEWSYLRLTSLNEFRRGMLKQIPEEKRYLFPWYEFFSDYDGVLWSMVDPNGHPDLLPEDESHEPREVIHIELQRDRELLDVVKAMPLLFKVIKKDLNKSSAVSLWRLGERERKDYLVPEAIERTGYEAIASSLVLDGSEKSSSKTEKIYWKFMHAFCAPSLSDGQRIRHLIGVKKEISHIEIDENMSMSVRKILETLKGWFSYQCSDEHLSREAFQVWTRALEESRAWSCHVK